MLPDVYGPAEARDLIGVNRQRFAVLAKRDGFPPARELAAPGGTLRVWDGPALRAWNADRSDGRAHAPMRRTKALQSYRKTGNIARAAAAAGADPSTVRRWFRALDIALPNDDQRG